MLSIQFCENLSSCLPTWLYYIPVGVGESSFLHILPGILFGFLARLVGVAVLHCFNLWFPNDIWC
jgi:hypothetical protein